MTSRLMLISIVFFLLLSSGVNALKILNDGYNMTTSTDAFFGLTGANKYGMSSYTPCGCSWYNFWCKWTCPNTPPNSWNDTTCFWGDGGVPSVGKWLASYNGASGVGYLENNYCNYVPGWHPYTSAKVYAKAAFIGWDGNPAPGAFTEIITTPSMRTTVFATIKYMFSNITVINTTGEKYPILAIYDPYNLTFIPAAANLTLNATNWSVTTVWATFNTSTNITAAMLIPEIVSMPYQWKIYVDYFRVGYVDEDKYVTTYSSSNECAWSTGGSGCGWSGNLNGTYYIGNVSTVYFALIGNSLGEDSNVPCEVMYLNYSDKSGYTGKISVRMTEIMPPWANYWDRGGGTWADINGWFGGSYSWCNLLLRDMLFHNDDEYYWNLAPSYSFWERSIGMIDFVNSTYVRPSWFYLLDSCPGICVMFHPSHSYCTGSMEFNDTGIIKGISECSIVNPSLGYYRYPINLSAYNVTNQTSSWRLNNFAVYWSWDGFSTPWIPINAWMTMFNASCIDDVGFHCVNNTQYYEYANCTMIDFVPCGSCGCSNITNKCVPGYDHWECVDNITALHYTEGCVNDKVIACEFGCTGGKCKGQDLCTGLVSCHDYCDKDAGKLYTDPYCDNTTGVCDWYSYELCEYGCSDIFNTCNPKPILGSVINVTASSFGMSSTDTQTMLAIIISLIVSTIVTYAVSYKGGFGGGSIVFGLAFIGMITLFTAWNPPWINILVYVILLILSGMLVVWRVSRAVMM